MLKAVLTKPGEIVFQVAPLPAPAAGAVRIKVRRIGICGSDIYVFHGKNQRIPYPVVQGHEMSGVVDACGEGVADLAPGDRVIIIPRDECGTCFQCRDGRDHICVNLRMVGFKTEGVAAEYSVFPAYKTLKIPDAVSLDEAAMIEPLSVAVHAVGRAQPPFSKVLVFGAGTIGNLVAQTAKALGADQVVACDPSAFRREIALRCGLDAAVDPAGVPEALARFFGERGADVVFECSGVEAAVNQAIASARKGSEIVQVGFCTKPPAADIGMLQNHELTLKGSQTSQRRDYIQAMDLLVRGQVRPAPLISRHFPFAQYPDAYRFIENNGDQAMKIMIDMP